MQFDKNTPKREITIKEVTLKVISPYSEGHALSAEEANVMNQTLGENLRNNFAGVVNEAKTAAGGADKVDVAALQAQLNDYMAEYQFGARRSSSVAVNPIAKIALSLAKDAVKKALTKAGKNWKDYTAEQLSELASAAVAKNPAFMDNAEKVHEAKKAAGAEALLDIAA